MKKLIPIAFICFLFLMGSVAPNGGPPWVWRLKEIRHDFYGKGWWNKNMMLKAIDNDWIDVDDICEHINGEEMTSEEFEEFLVFFIEHLGYDDMIVFDTIWNYCKENRIDYLESYISEHEGQWSQDFVGPAGISMHTLKNTIVNAINWLLGTGRSVTKYEKAVAEALDKFCMSRPEFEDRFIWLERKVTIMEEFLAKKFGAEYCDYEAYRLIVDYGYEKVECGETTYFPKEGGGIVGITPA